MAVAFIPSSTYLYMVSCIFTAVAVEHLTSRLAAEWSEHKNVVRNKADALMSLRQKMKAETMFAELENAPQDPNATPEVVGT